VKSTNYEASHYAVFRSPFVVTSITVISNKILMKGDGRTEKVSVHVKCGILFRSTAKAGDVGSNLH